jgi:hypothetical protein
MIKMLIKSGADMNYKVPYHTWVEPSERLVDFYDFAVLMAGQRERYGLVPGLIVKWIEKTYPNFVEERIAVKKYNL